MSDQEEKLPASTPKVDPVWGIAANVLKERPYGEGGKEIKRGTLKFYGGAKVYIAEIFWGIGGEKVKVIGHYRGKHRYITSGLDTKHLENFRVEMIYSPEIIRRVKIWNQASLNKIDGSDESKQVVTQLAESLAKIAQSIRDHQASKWAQQQNQAGEQAELSDDSNNDSGDIIPPG